MRSEMKEGSQCLCSLVYLYGYEKKMIKTFNESHFLLPSIPRILKCFEHKLHSQILAT